MYVDKNQGTPPWKWHIQWEFLDFKSGFGFTTKIYPRLIFVFKWMPSNNSDTNLFLILQNYLRPFQQWMPLLSCSWTYANEYWQWKFPKALIGCLSGPIDSNSPKLQWAMWLGQMKIFRTHALHFVSKLVIIYNMQLCGFHCITWYSFCILVISPMYFYCFNALLFVPQQVPVAKKYQMWSDVMMIGCLHQK